MSGGDDAWRAQLMAGEQKLVAELAAARADVLDEIDPVCCRCRAAMALVEPDHEPTDLCHSCVYEALDEARAEVVALTRALETAQARIDVLVSERERDAAPAEPSTAEEYETLTEAPSTYEALLNGADAIDARRKGGV